jgi:hypothetical protein
MLLFSAVKVQWQAATWLSVFVSSGEPTEMFEAREAAFECGFVVCRKCCREWLAAYGGLGRNDCNRIYGFYVIGDRVAVVALVSQHPLGPSAL